MFDPHRLGWVLAMRTMIGLLLPLILARLLDLPALAWVGIGAYLLAIGDCMDDGDHQQPLRLAIGSLLGGLALATGVLAGASLPLAVAGMLVWGVLTGLLGVYGNAFATMALPVAWAYVELGLPSADHALSTALFMGSLFVLGGGLTLVLTLTLRIGGPYAVVRLKAAACYRALTTYCAADEETGPISSETRVRAAIADARRTAAEIRGRAPGSSRVGQQSLVLVEIADRLFSLAGALREDGCLPPSRFRQATTALAAALEGRYAKESLRALASEIAHTRARSLPVQAAISAEIERRMGRALYHALLIAAGDEAPPSSLAQPAPLARLSQLFAPLVGCLGRDSVVGRHALRFAVVCAAAVVVFWAFPKPFGYWVPLTATVVLKPYAGTTLARAVQRIAGTTAGILVGMTLMPLLPSPALQLALVSVAFFCMMAVLPFNYSLAIFFLSVGLIPFEHILTPGLKQDLGLLRLAATAIGALLALVGGHLLWPTFESRTLPTLVRASLVSVGAYADQVLGALEGNRELAAVAEARRRAGSDTTDLQSVLQRTLAEVGSKPGLMVASLRASTALQRLMRTLNALMNAAPALAQPWSGLKHFRTAFVAALSELAAVQPGLPVSVLRAPIPASMDPDNAVYLDCMLERLIFEFEMLRDALCEKPHTLP
ncbi:FUSC family protein [Methylobacterium crusticola]|uniref:FUSC family protein n=1 Tax=Methylobacterium crusticola TaxID=1697972 RepID=UPI0013968910|nr:FUSC family protein [Methylobacterium crusticola]